MAEASAIRLDGAKQADVEVECGIKKEIEVKPEPHECVVCATSCRDGSDMSVAVTLSGTSLTNFLSKYTPVDLVVNNPKQICRSCHDLINILEQTETEYLKLKETFEAIISKNPLFDSRLQSIGTVKLEISEETYNQKCDDDDSEDEPLALTKKKRHRKTVKRKKKVCSANKRKQRNKNNDKDRWECDVCGAQGMTGGLLARTAHQLAAHTLDSPVRTQLRDIKKEDSVDGSESSHFNNGLDMFKVEFSDSIAFSDDNDSSNFTPDELSNGERKVVKRSNLMVATPRKSKKMPIQKTRKKREVKVMHPCDQCDAKYTSLRRLELHREKHSEGKPPYICEVCGARYKHKRACDVHVALHKGISDWKCEECNKLFPSKGALQRHNNIHTGKLNYQCDLCGKSFIHTSSFKMHKLSHSGVKPHACDVCGLALMTRSHLKRHKRVHSGEKRHECAVCGKRFSERYNLAAHSKSHEGALPAELGAAPLPKRRLFRCTFCQERFERRYMLERHTSLAHGRTLERVPATPRNTMSKLLKAQAAARAHGDPASTPTPTPTSTPTPAGAHADSRAAALETKPERSPESRASSAPHKLHISSASTTVSAGSWSGAYAAEFGLRHDFPH